MHIRIFEPNPRQDRWVYRVVFFPDEGSPVVCEACCPEEAESMAENLARHYGCSWKHLPNLESLSHWVDEAGQLRVIDRIELVDLGNGRGQFNCFAGKVRFSTDMGELQWLAEHMRFWLAAWLDEEWKPAR